MRNKQVQIFKKDTVIYKPSVDHTMVTNLQTRRMLTERLFKLLLLICTVFTIQLTRTITKSQQTGPLN